MSSQIADLMEKVLMETRRYDAAQPEFLQAVEEVFKSLVPFLERYPNYLDHALIQRLVIPDRIVIFRVSWIDDKGNSRANRGYRVQFNNALGPYKGGLRFHPTVYLGVLKFLGFEQVFKNALTTLPMGGAKGGSDFDPHGRSEAEIMRFCNAFMTELYSYIGPTVDVPAGDIGVGQREIGYMFGTYKRLTRSFDGALTGKGALWGGSHIRPEATGYGLVYFVQEILGVENDSLKGKVVAVSGSGNVAQYTVEKAIEFGAKCVTLSDSQGFIYDPDGIDQEKLEFVKELKNVKRGRIREYVEKYPKAQFHEGQRPWGVPCDVALPCATQNELDGSNAQQLVKNGCRVVAEGANMPCTPDAINCFHANGVIYGPGKAANAGGVSVSGLEMAQNAMHVQWSREEVDAKLRDIMHRIFDQCRSTAVEFGQPRNYQLGANIAAFKRVAQAMFEQGLGI
jgi:glutamate dehydrogenase (NADP+)